MAAICGALVNYIDANIVFSIHDYYSLPQLLGLQSTTKSTTPSTTPTPTPTAEITTPSPSTSPPPTVCPMPGKPAQQAGAIGFGYDLNSHVMYTITKDSVLSKLISSK